MKHKSIYLSILGAFGMFLIILDSKSSINGALEGIEICLKTVIPSLFPLFYFSGILQAAFSGQTIPFLRPIAKLCSIPEGAEYLLLIGISGGYPLGAQNIEYAYASNKLQRKDAERMLGFCNNAGPAFIFGMAGSLFSAWYIGWILWGIQIVSCLICGMLLPSQEKGCYRATQNNNINITQIMISAIKSMGVVCGWIVLFRVIIYLLNKWIFWILPQSISVLITGFLELSNGCIALSQVYNPAFRFVVISSLMALGGLCIAVQTISVTDQLSCRFYFIGKLLQLSAALPLATICSIFLFPGNISALYAMILILLPFLFLLLYGMKNKNNSGNYVLHGV